MADMGHISRLGTWLATTSLLIVLPGNAQSPSSTRAAFEVASIKPNKSGGETYLRPTVRGTLNARNVSLRTLIQSAYEVPEWQMAGGPAWIDSDKYDVEAKGPHTEGFTSFEDLQQMMQALLADRFQLKVHHEKRELPMYALVTARGGPKLMRASGDNCYVVTRTTRPADMGGLPQCGSFTVRRADVSGLKVTTAALVQVLGYTLHSVVSDETGLDGREYDMHLQWTPDDIGVSPPQPGGTPAPLPDAVGPSIFTAVQEQLGLKLESRKGPVDVVVIDHAEKPSEN
jgi:uncharacterized protein (TIGR03435 family)